MILLYIVDFEFNLTKPLTRSSSDYRWRRTFFSYGRSKENLPKRTWNGEQASEPAVVSPMHLWTNVLHRTIFLFDYNDVDSAAESSWID